MRAKRTAIALVACFCTALASFASAASLTYLYSDGAPGITVIGMEQNDARNAVPSAENPILVAENIYAPDVVAVGAAQWFMYFGGWWDSSLTGHDDIYLWKSDDLHPEGYWDPQGTDPYGRVIFRGAYDHVNDPSIELRGATWVMAYTVANDPPGNDLYEWIAVSTSSDGVTWNPVVNHEFVSISGLPRAWDPDTVARPSLVWDDSQNRWLLFFDVREGQSQFEPRHSCVAQGLDKIPPKSFQLIGCYADLVNPDNGDTFPGFMEPDVERITLPSGSVIWRAVIQSWFNSLWRCTSTDGVSWSCVDPDAWLSVDDVAMIEQGVNIIHNPSIVHDWSGVRGFAYGQSFTDSTHNQIGFGYSQFRLEVEDCTGRGTSTRRDGTLGMRIS